MRLHSRDSYIVRSWRAIPDVVVSDLNGERTEWIWFGIWVHNLEKVLAKLINYVTSSMR